MNEWRRRLLLRKIFSIYQINEVNNTGAFMDIYDFCEEVFHPRATILTAIGGGIAGKFCGISPIHGAVYAVASRVACQAAIIISDTVLDKCDAKLSKELKKGFMELVATPLIMTSAYLGYTKGNKALSLIGRRLVFDTAVKVSLVSGIAGFFSGLLIGYIFDYIEGN